MNTKDIQSNNNLIVIGGIAIAGLLGVATAFEPVWAVALLVIFIAGIFIMLNSKLGVGLILLSIILGQIVRIPIGDSGSILMTDLVIPIVLLSWFYAKVVKREPLLVKTALDAPITAVLLVFGLSFLLALPKMLESGVALEGLGYILRLLSYTAVYYVVTDLIKDKNTWSRYYYQTILAGYAIAVLGILQLVLVPSFEFMSRYGWDPHINRLLSTFFDPNFVGGFLAIVAIIVFASMLYVKKPETKALLFFGFTLLTACIVLTFSRSSYLTLAIGLLVIGFVKSWRTLLLIFIISLLAFTTIPRVRERVLGAVSLDVTAQARLVSFGQAFDIIKDYPIFGVGYNNLRSVRAEYGQITDSGQNHTAGGFDSSLLTIWATTGVLGLLAYLWLYVIMIYESFKAYHKSSHSSQKALGLGMGAGLVGLFVHSQIVNSFFYPHIFLYLWFLLAVLMAGKRVYANRY